MIRHGARLRWAALLVAMAAMAAPAPARAATVVCPDGSPRLRVEVRDLLAKAGWKLEVDVFGLSDYSGRLSLGQGEVQRTAAGVAMLREYLTAIAASYNACALSPQDYARALAALSSLQTAEPTLARALTALGAGREVDMRRLGEALSRVEREVRQLAELGALAPKLDWLVQEVKAQSAADVRLRDVISRYLEADEARRQSEKEHPLATAEELRRTIERQIQASGEEALRAYDLGMDSYRKYRFREAAEAFERAIALFPSSHFHAALGNAALALGDSGWAEKAFRDGIAAAAAQHDPSQEAVLHILYGRALYEKGDFSAARNADEEARKIDERESGPYSAAVAVDLSYLAQALLRQNDLQGARSILDRARQLNERLHGPQSLEVAANHSDLGILLDASGDAKGAREEYRAALQIEREKNAPEVEHRSNLASALSALGQNLINTRTDMKEGLKDLEEARDLDLEIYGPEHERAANDAASLCNAHAVLRDLAKADEECRAAVVTSERVLGREHWETAAYLRVYAALLQQLGRSAEALPLLRRALTIHVATLGPDNPQTQTDYNDLGLLLRGLRRFDESLGYLDCALRIAQQGGDDLRRATILNNIGSTLAASGACERALFHFLEALALVEAKTAPGEIDRAFHLNSVGFLLWQMGDRSGASFLEDSLAILESHGDPHAPEAAANLRAARSGPAPAGSCTAGPGTR